MPRDYHRVLSIWLVLMLQWLATGRQRVAAEKTEGGQVQTHTRQSEMSLITFSLNVPDK